MSSKFYLSNSYTIAFSHKRKVEVLKTTPSTNAGGGYVVDISFLTTVYLTPPLESEDNVVIRKVRESDANKGNEWPGLTEPSPDKKVGQAPHLQREVIKKRRQIFSVFLLSA